MHMKKKYAAEAKQLQKDAREKAMDKNRKSISNNNNSTLSILDITQKAAARERRLRVLKLMPTESGCAIGSVEGKMAISYFFSSHSRDYNFKTDLPGVKWGPPVISPVNANARNPV
ncbi:hypothetical protein BGZ65_000812 [Modicella reniformis]|uniref:Uncharacterized protein n=1 Tax=Modicella reniformis TaxID=1440133 RepID=A0A9P6JCM3_9FUNG|nr:hypothetical protein BGZ65_000812 [Modicella reniformis]